MTNKRYEVINRDTGISHGIYGKEVINKVGFKSDNFIIKEVTVKTEADIIKEEGRF